MRAECMLRQGQLQPQTSCGGAWTLFGRTLLHIILARFATVKTQRASLKGRESLRPRAACCAPAPEDHPRLSIRARASQRL